MNSKLLSNGTPIRLIAIARTMKPKYQGTSAIALPVKLRLGRPGTFTQDTIHFVYQTNTHGTGMMKHMPISITMLRQVNSRMPKSTASDPLPPASAYPPEPIIGGPPAGIIGGP